MSEFRKRVRAVVREELRNVEDELSALGLSAELRALQPRSLGHDQESATEVSVHIRDAGQLVDMLECFIERGGEPTVSVDDVRQWVRRELRALIRDYPAGGGWEAV